MQPDTRSAHPPGLRGDELQQIAEIIGVPLDGEIPVNRGG